MIENLLLLKSKSVLCISDSSKETQIMKMFEVLFGKVFLADNYNNAIALYEDESPDFIIADIKLLHGDGIKLIKKIRQFDYRIPIIILTEHNQTDILIEITNLSVDGYLCKPLDYLILSDVLFRSIKRNQEKSGLVIIDTKLVFNIATKELYMNGSVVALGTKEKQLLLLLLDNRSKTITKEEIARKLWPLNSVSDSALKKLVLRIRQKMNNDIILSVRGIGYRLDTRLALRTNNGLKVA